VLRDVYTQSVLADADVPRQRGDGDDGTGYLKCRLDSIEEHGRCLGRGAEWMKTLAVSIPQLRALANCARSSRIAIPQFVSMERNGRIVHFD